MLIRRQSLGKTRIDTSPARRARRGLVPSLLAVLGKPSRYAVLVTTGHSHLPGLRSA